MIKQFSVQILLALIVALWTGGSHSPETTFTGASSAGESDCSLPNVAFQPGEEIVYKIYYNLTPLWIPAGEVHFKVEDAGGDYRLSAEASTYKSYEWFYKGIYDFESLVDKQSLMPHVFVRTIEEKKYSRYNKFIFDHNNNTVASWEGPTAREATLKRLHIAPCMHDLLSVMYYMRNVNIDQYREGEVFPVNVFLEEEYPLSIRVLGKNKLQKIRGFGEELTHVISPELIAGEYFNEDAQMTIWVSADQNRVPLMIESPVRVGNIKAVLQSHKGLRYTMR